MTYDQPLYQLRHAFDPRPVLVAFGITGLIDVASLLEPSLYVIGTPGSGDQLGLIEFFANGRWRILMDDGTVAGTWL